MFIREYDLELSEDKTPSLVKEKEFEYATSKLTNPGSIVEMMNCIYHMDRKAEESVYVVGFDNKNNVIAVFELSKGSANGSIVSTRSLFIRLLVSGCTGFVVLHNHTSGETHPSKEDIAVFRKVKDSAELLNVRFLDFIIVGKNSYYSCNKEGYLK